MMMRQENSCMLKSFQDFENDIPLDDRPDKLSVHSNGKEVVV
jgi:hypothetical protein